MRIAIWLVALQIPLLAAFPRPDGYVNDFASVLAEADEAYLEGFLRTLEGETSAEIAVATVSSLEGMTIEEYSNRLFIEWGIGKKQRDNGVLLLVAPHDRTVRIEVGYGLEAILPDGLAGEIIRTEIVPEFKAGNVPRGIGRGLNRIAQIVRRDPAAIALGASGTQDDRPPAILVIPLVGLFIALAAFVAGLAIRTRTFGPLLFSGLFAGVPLVIATEFASVLWLAALALFGLLVLAAGYRSGRSAYWRGMLRNGTPGSVREEEPLAWVMGGTSGSSTSDGSSSDGSGDSSSSDFGGGSSGGGGASGRW